MAVPKRKVSKARRDQRSANKNIQPRPFVTCPNSACSNEPLLPHMACPHCGFYRGRKVLRAQVDQDVRRSEKQAAVASQDSEQNDATQEQAE